MAAATAERATQMKSGTVRAEGIPMPVKSVAATSVTYKGCMVSVINGTGYIRDATDAAGELFAGVAQETTVGGATDGAVTCKVKKHGIYRWALIGGAVTDLQKEALMVDNQSVQVGATTASIKCGRIVQLEGTTFAWVQIDGYC